MDGIINVYKEKGWTSFDVTKKLRAILHEKKIGHTGTLDPMAEGVLVICAGTATKLVSSIEATEKVYEAEMKLGILTDTEDTTGTILSEHPVDLSEEELRAAAQSFVGSYDQIPPMYSAKKVNGQKLYDLARQGKVIERKPNRITIHDITVDSIDLPYVRMTVTCSKGTYIRVLGEDLATALGTCGTMSFLLRTQVGAYTIDKAYTLQEVAANPEACAAAPLTAVDALPKLSVNARQAARITNGVRTTLAGTADGRYALLGPNGEFLGIARCEDERLQAEKILAHYALPEE